MIFIPYTPCLSVQMNIREIMKNDNGVGPFIYIYIYTGIQLIVEIFKRHSWYKAINLKYTILLSNYLNYLLYLDYKVWRYQSDLEDVNKIVSLRIIIHFFDLLSFTFYEKFANRYEFAFSFFFFIFFFFFSSFLFFPVLFFSWTSMQMNFLSY